MKSKQSTLHSGANAELVFARFEHSAAWFHEAADEGLAEAAADGRRTNGA